MKALFLALMTILLALPAVADSLYVCKPDPAKKNDHGIKRLEARVSSEDPDAQLTTWLVSGGRPDSSWMSVEGDDTQMTLIPVTERDGELVVGLKQIVDNVFTSFVTDDDGKTSELSCIEMPSYYIYDFTGSNFDDDSINLMDDGLPYVEQGYAFRVDGEWDRDFTIQVTASNPSASHCSYQVLSKSSEESVIVVLEDLEVDTGDTCTYRVKKSSGATASFEFYSTGT